MVSARRAARKAVESNYEGVCDIIEYGSVRDKKSMITRQEETVIARDVPCKLSFENITAADQSDTGAAVAQSVKLFIAPEIEVRSGSKIVVAQNGVTTEYAASGQSAVYSSHQEIMLKLWKEWA